MRLKRAKDLIQHLATESGAAAVEVTDAVLEDSSNDTGGANRDSDEERAGSPREDGSDAGAEEPDGGEPVRPGDDEEAAEADAEARQHEDAYAAPPIREAAGSADYDPFARISAAALYKGAKPGVSMLLMMLLASAYQARFRCTDVYVLSIPSFLFVVSSTHTLLSQLNAMLDLMDLLTPPGTAKLGSTFRAHQAEMVNAYV
jgi:hypothetical protein